MTTYRVRFYQNAYSPDGHSTKRLVRQVDVVAECPSQALIEAQAGLQAGLEGSMGADSIEVGYLIEDPHADHACHPPRAA